MEEKKSDLNESDKCGMCGHDPKTKKCSECNEVLGNKNKTFCNKDCEALFEYRQAYGCTCAKCKKKITTVHYYAKNNKYYCEDCGFNMT